MSAATVETASSSRNQRWLVPGLIAVILFQVLVLVSEWAIAHYPLWQGTEIRVRVMPVDPRDLFRGNYARLDYGFSRLPQALADARLQRGDVVYVSLARDAQGEWQANSISRKQPDDGMFLRARVERVEPRVWRPAPSAANRSNNDVPSEPAVFSRGTYRLRYGIEAFFAPKEKAVALERSMRGNSHWAIIRVAENGRAALLDVHADEKRR